MYPIAAIAAMRLLADKFDKGGAAEPVSMSSLSFNSRIRRSAVFLPIAARASRESTSSPAPSRSTSSTGVSVVYLGLVPLPDLVPKDREVAKTLLLVHRSLNYLLAAIVTIHVAAALKHQFVDRDGVLDRMLHGR